jgi:damage-control phosphatase, subfamily II, stand-alone protein
MTSPSTPFVKLADPTRYIACSSELVTDDEGRTHWVEFFKRHLNTILTLGIDAAVVRGAGMEQATTRAEECRSEFCKWFDEFTTDPAGAGRHGVERVTILTLDQWRDMFLRKFGFDDAFIDLKDRENALALPLLPTVCQQIDLLSGQEQLRAIIEGVFAGNIFDMGAEATAKAFLHASPDFFATRKTLTPRPWLIDDYDALAKRLLEGPLHRKVVFFIDNAGGDFILGAIPMIRWLAKRDSRVVIAANERPTLNDMTIHDVNAWWPRVLDAEPSLRDLPIYRVSTGTGEPLIDLSQVSAQLNDAAADADLVILEGMGRGVESNLDAAFSCDAVNLAMIKDVAVANNVGGKVFDIVCRFR